MSAINIEGLTKYYGKSRGVIDIDLSVEEGEFFGFIGPNGAGKSTTIRSLIGLLRPSSGHAKIFGRDCWSEKETILNDVGYLPSENAFYPGMRVREVLALSADLRRRDCRAEADALCERLGLDPGKKAAELSFGNRKKLSIVCALQHKPKVLILDEPTGGLDPLMQRAFFEILDERNAEGTTIFFSSHILSEVQRHCRRAAVIKNGKIAACDEVEKLIGNHVKRIDVVGTADFAGLEGMRNEVRTDDGISFLYNGSMERLIEVLSKGTVSDLAIHEPELEEVFMHYYEEA